MRFTNQEGPLPKKSALYCKQKDGKFCIVECSPDVYAAPPKPGTPLIAGHLGKNRLGVLHSPQFVREVSEEGEQSLPICSISESNVNIITVESDDDADASIKFLCGQNQTEPSNIVLGVSYELDQFKKRPRILVLAVASGDVAVVFRLSKLNSALSLLNDKILKNKDIEKVGVMDMEFLDKKCGLTLEGYRDLSTYGAASLSHLCKTVLGEHIKQQEHLSFSDWDTQDKLSREQVEHAAQSAWLCGRIYRKIIADSDQK